MALFRLELSNLTSTTIVQNIMTVNTIKVVLNTINSVGQLLQNIQQTHLEKIFYFKLQVILGPKN